MITERNREMSREVGGWGEAKSSECFRKEVLVKSVDYC